MSGKEALKQVLPPIAIRAARFLLRSNGTHIRQPAPPPQEQDFVRWLRFANAGMLLDGNVSAMSRATRNLPATGSLLEIGSFCGLSTNVFILFDDSSDTYAFEGVRRVIQEIRASGRYEIVEQNPNYLVRKKLK